MIAPSSSAVATSIAPPVALPKAFPAGEEAWRYDHAWRILNMNQELIRATDQKIYMLIVMSTLLVSFTANNLDRLSHAGWLHDAILPLLGLAAIAFFIFALATLLARHDPIAQNISPSLVFFGHIRGRHGIDAYRRDFMASDQHQVIDDLLSQVVIISSILCKKLESYRRAWWCLGFQVVIFIGLNVSGRFT